MKSTRLTRGALIAATSAFALTMTACGSDAADEAGDAVGSATSAASSAAESATSSETTEASSDQPFGDACSLVPTSGEGSFDTMSAQPVATAASGNPVLSTLVQAVTAANLVDTLNSAEDITVLAPANPAFEAVPSENLNALLADVPQLTSVLQHHVIGGRLAPDALAGEQTTLLGDTVTIEGSGESFTISADQTLLASADANVICGNVQTENATVYIIDQVLAPAAA